MKKRIISLLLCLCMVFSLLPTVVLAEGEDPTASTDITMQYDDYADYGANVTVPSDDAVLEVVGGKLHAKGVGKTTITLGSPMRPVFTVGETLRRLNRPRAIPIGGMAG